MEFRELATGQIKQSVIHSFNLVSSGFYVGLLGSTSEAIVLEMKHSFLSTQKFPFLVEVIALPSKRNTSDIVNTVDMSVIYSKSNALTRQYISLDPVYVSDIAEQQVEIQPIVITWSPTNLFNQSTLAIVSSNGSCILRRRNSIRRDWNIPFCDINEFYSEIFPIERPENINTFEKLTKNVESWYTTSFSWNRDYPCSSNNYFVVSNATGWIILFMVGKEGNISYSNKHQTSLGRIAHIDFYKNLIFVCSTAGVMKIYTLKHTSIEETVTLWNKADRISCKKVNFQFSVERDKWIIVTTKASHILVFILSKQGVIEAKSTKYLGSMEITGFEMLSPFEYVVVTITGLVQLVTLKKKQHELEIIVSDVKYDFDKKNYQILGVVASPNRVAWTFILFHNKPYSHPSSYSPNDAILSICSLNVKDAFTILKNESGPNNKCLDCAEIVRLEIMKDNAACKSTHILLDSVKISREFLKKLQLKLMVISAEISHHKLKNNYINKITSERNSIIKIIEYVYINLRLQYLRCLKSLTPFQGLSGKCLKYKLKSMQAELVTNEDIYRNIYENLNTLSDCLLMDLGSLFDMAEENCSYCHLAIDFETLLCPNAHNVPRCSISFVQVPMFTRVCCTSCNRLYFDKLELLESIFADREEMKCTYCGFMLDVEMTDIFD